MIQAVTAAVRSIAAASRCAVMVLAVCAGVAGCSSTGYRFDASALERMTPGVTRYSDAEQALGAPPVQVYRDTRGGYVAWWRHKTSIVTDGLYGRQAVALAFDADDRLLRLIDTEGVLVPQWARTHLLGWPPAPVATPCAGACVVAIPVSAQP